MAKKEKKTCPHCDYVEKQVLKRKDFLTACICGQSFAFKDGKALKIPHDEALKLIEQAA